MDMDTHTHKKRKIQTEPFAKQFYSSIKQFGLIEELKDGGI